MIRLVLIFILLLLPLQASWAADGAYAHNGEGEQAHHSATHKHQNSDNHSSDTHPDKLNDHCSFSHAGGVALTGSSQLNFSSLPMGAVPPHHLARLPAPVPQRPERPNWRVFA